MHDDINNNNVLNIVNNDQLHLQLLWIVATVY